MNFCNLLHLGKFILNRAKLKSNWLTYCESCCKKGCIQASVRQSIHASWPNKPNFVLSFYCWAHLKNDYIAIF